MNHINANKVKSTELILRTTVLLFKYNSNEDMPYKFNGKEMDEEMGLYYYGARYMNPITSLWYGVDQMTEKYTEIGAYVYCNNNPIKFIDLDGKDWYQNDEGTSTFWQKGSASKIETNGEIYFSIGKTYTHSYDWGEVNYLQDKVTNVTVWSGVSTARTIIKIARRVEDGREYFASSLKENSGNARIGSNGKIYSETEIGGVFHGNQYVSTKSLAKIGAKWGKGTLAVGLAFTGLHVYDAYHKDGNSVGHNTKVAVAEETGSWAGAFAGAKLCAAIGFTVGSVVPVIGNTAGTIAGGIIGACLGSYGGEKLMDEMIK